MGIHTEEELVSPQRESPKIRKLGECLLLRGFTELQECISRKMLAESAGWKSCRAAWRLARMVISEWDGRECVCMRTCGSPCPCVLCGGSCRQLLRKLPDNNKTWHESPGTEGQRRWQKMRCRLVILEAGVWGRQMPHSYLPDP